MKNSILLLIAEVFAFSVAVYSQDAMISFTLNDYSVNDVFSAIKEQTDYSFWYDVKDVDVTRRVSLRAENETVKTILLQALKDQDVDFTVFGNHIIIAKKGTFDPSVAQQIITISGMVTDEMGYPLPGVTVAIKGLLQGTATDVKGVYSLQVPHENISLVFSYIGYVTQEIIVGTQRNINISMNESTKQIEEVVVIGYGTARKRDLTGAIVQVNAAITENERPQQVQDILRGRVPGLNIGYSTSAKGDGSMIVRGVKSIREDSGDQASANTPLIVLDGVIYPGALADINPNDIETLDILKDASSAAVYGAKAASGVIAITTKRGKAGKPIINVNSSVGVSTMSTYPGVYGPYEFLDWRREVFRSTNRYGSQADKLYIFDNPKNLASGVTMDMWLDGQTGDAEEIWLRRLAMRPIELNNYRDGRYVDWYDVAFRNGFRQDHNVSLSGRKDDVSYFWSLGYNKNEGLRVGDDYSVYRSRLNVDAKIANFLTVGANTSFSFRDESGVPAAAGEVANATPWGSYYADDGVSIRYSPVDDSAGSATHPLHEWAYTDRYRVYTNLLAQLYAKITLPFGITYTLTYTPHWQWVNNFQHQSSKSGLWANNRGISYRENSTTFEWQLDNVLKWDKVFGDHRFDVTLLANAEKYQYWFNRIDAQNYIPNDQLSWHYVGAALSRDVRSDDQYSTGDALMARLIYSFKDRYIGTFTARRDGYSAFGRLNPRANFGSVGLAWIFSEEGFMEGFSWLDFAKLRVNWGTNGNRNIGRYVAYEEMGRFAAANDRSISYPYESIGGATSELPIFRISRMGNESLKWETTENLEFGLDFRLLKNLLDVSIGAYRSNTTDVLLNRQLIYTIGFPSVTSNLGHVRNVGGELSVNANIFERENFRWSSGFIFYFNRNKIIRLYGNMENILDAQGNVIGQKESDDITNSRFIGKALDVVWDYKILGVWQENEYDEAQKWNQYPGDFKIYDSNGDYRLTNDDKVFLGFKEPRFRWNWNNSFTVYKHFDVSFRMYSYWGHLGEFNNAKNRNAYVDRNSTYKIPYYTPEKPQTQYARIQSLDPGGVGFSVWWKRSFIRLDNVSVAYNVPRELSSKAHIQQMKLFATVNNACFWAPDWKHWDPESNSYFPRNWTFGINLSL